MCDTLILLNENEKEKNHYALIGILKSVDFIIAEK